MRFILKTDHRPDCTASALVERGDWNHPWCFDGKVYRDTLGRRHPHTYRTWFKFICNSPLSVSCDAEVLVSCERIMEELEGALEMRP